MIAGYIVHLRPEPSTVPGEVRIRRLLKAALRAYGLRCVAVTQADAPQIPTPEPVSPPSVAATARATPSEGKARTKAAKTPGQRFSGHLAGIHKELAALAADPTAVEGIALVNSPEELADHVTTFRRIAEQAGAWADDLERGGPCRAAAGAIDALKTTQKGAQPL